MPAGQYAPYIVVLLTDGVNTTGPEPVFAAEFAKTRGVRVYTIGFGTAQEDAPMNCGGFQGGGNPNDPNQFFFGGGGGGGGVVVPPLPDFTQYGQVERQPQSKLLKTAAANLSLSWQVIPHVTQHELIDVTDLEAGRKRFVQAHAKSPEKPKVTMTVLAVKAAVAALKAFPQFNASYDAATSEVLYKRYYNIGIAVDTEHGLVVPVVKEADKKSVLQIAQEITDLATKARARKLSPSEMQGGSFTITNLGGIGGSFFTPIVNYPEVAILGMSRASQQYLIQDDKPEIRLMMPVSLSYDHRVINGADGARFITKLAQLLTDPLALLSEV